MFGAAVDAARASADHAGTRCRPAFLSPLPAGALSEWLADHPVMINSVLPLVLHALGNPELSVSSVSTLKKICRECKYDLPPYAANIVAVSQVCGALARAAPPGTLCLVLMPCSSSPQDVLMKQIHKVSSRTSRGLHGGLWGACEVPSSARFCSRNLHIWVCERLILLFCPTDKPVHVADAGAGLPAVGPAGGGDS